jgi:CRISPR-associated protein Cmr1
MRGQLRYWLRATLGNVIGDQKLDALKAAESEVFGNTKGAGAVAVRVVQKNLPHEKINPLPHKDSPTRFDGFLAQQKFDVILTQHHGAQVAWLATVGALLLMVSFGGLGRRSRRGWGTMRILRVQPQKAELKENWLQLLQMRPDSPEAWQVYLSQAYKASLSASRSLCRTLNLSSQAAQRPTAFPILGTQLLGWLGTTVYPQPQDAVKAFGEREHKFGITKAFGSADKPRWASPLWVRVFPVKQPKPGYVLSMALLESQSEVANYEHLREFIKEWSDLKEVLM